MLVNKISNVNFRDNSNNINNNKYMTRDLGSQNAILMLRDPNASVKFQHNKVFAQNADSVSTNPLKALGYKLYRTFSMIKADNQDVQSEQKQFSAIA